MTTLNIETPRAFLPFLEPARYKAAFGGRGGAKSHQFAENLIERCYMQPTRAACLREVQNSIRESVRQLLIDKISKLGLNWFFTVTESEIRGNNGSLIVFKGLQSYNADNIKSLEGFDIGWVEEAQTLSSRALKLLRPTFRKPGSELWFTWNPRFDTDPVDAFFRGPTPPENAVIRRVSYRDNPWMSDALWEEIRHDRNADPEGAVHVWDGGYEEVTEGAYYARLIAAAENEGRVGDFPYDPALPVMTAWDIGVDDYTAIWFLQQNGQMIRAVAYYETSGIGAEQIVPEAMPELVPLDQHAQFDVTPRAVPFTYARHYMPHDVMVREWGGGARTRHTTLTGLGVKPIMVGVAMNPAERVNATRKLLPIMQFNKATCSAGIRRLRRYSRRYNRVLDTYGGPLKDGNDHGADALGEFAVNCPLIAQRQPTQPKPPSDYGGAVFRGDDNDRSLAHL